MDNRYQHVEDVGGRFRGKKELLRHLGGETLTPKQMVLAKCYECMGYYADGGIDCGIENCPLYPFMPYNPNRVKRTRVMSEEAKDAMRERLAIARQNTPTSRSPL